MRTLTNNVEKANVVVSNARAARGIEKSSNKGGTRANRRFDISTYVPSMHVIALS